MDRPDLSAGGAPRASPRWWQRWRTRLLAAFLLVAAAVGVSEVVGVAGGYRLARQAALASQAETAVALARATERFVSRYAAVAGTAAAAIFEAPLTDAARHRLLATIRLTYPDISGAYVVDRGGRIVDADPAGATGLDVSGRAHYQQVLRGASVVVSDLMVGTFTRQFSIEVVAAGRGEDGALHGMVSVALPAAALDREVEVRLGAGARALVVDRTGRVVVHGGTSDLGWEQRDFSRRPLVAEALAGRPVLWDGLPSPVTGQPGLGALVPVPSLGWAAGVHQPADAALAPARRARARALATVAAVMGLAVALALLLSARLSSPVSALASGIAALARGDLGHRVAVRGRTELGVLAESFNAMAGRLERARSEQRALNEELAAANEELRASEARLRLALEAGRMGTWTWNLATGAVTWSPGLEAIHGLASGAFGGTFEAYLGDVHPEDRDRVVAALARAVEQGTDHDVEYRIVWPDGAVRWVEGKGRVLRDEAGRIVGMTGVCMDVTERKQAEEALRESQARLAGVVESAMDAIVTIDAAQRVTVFNRPAEEIFRCPAADALGQPIDRFIPEQFREAHAEHIRTFGRTEVTRRSMSRPDTLTALRADGEEFPIEATISQVEVGGQKLFTVILRDVTARRQAEAERNRLLARERAARAEAEAAGRRAAFLAEASTRLTASLDYGSTLASVARLTVPELADCCFVDLLEGGGSIRRVAAAHVHPDKEALLRELQRRYPIDPNGPHPVAKAIRTGQPVLVPEISGAFEEAVALDAEHLRLLRELGLRSGIVVPMLARGRTLGSIAVGSVDPGRRYGPADLELAEELARRAALAVDNARLYQEAQAAIRAREAFLACAAHELRTPLTSALGTVRWLKRAMAGALKESPEALVDIAQRSLEVMAALVSDLLDASKLAAGRESLAVEQVDLAELVRRSLEVIGPQAREKGVALRVSLPAGLCLPADPLKLEQVLVNLLANAVNFTPGGGAVVVDAEAGASGVLIRVRDTGEGIAREHLERIFEPFFQAGVRGRRRPRGTGLGLAICRQIVTLHGGTIQAESHGHGLGSTFTVRLPIASADGQTA